MYVSVYVFEHMCVFLLILKIRISEHTAERDTHKSIPSLQKGNQGVHRCQTPARTHCALIYRYSLSSMVDMATLSWKISPNPYVIKLKRPNIAEMIHFI